MWSELMMEAMSRDEGDGYGSSAGRRRMVKDGDGRGWGAPWRGDVKCGGVCEARKVLKTGTADDSDPDRICNLVSACDARSRLRSKHIA